MLACVRHGTAGAGVLLFGMVRAGLTPEGVLLDEWSSLPRWPLPLGLSTRPKGRASLVLGLSSSLPVPVGGGRKYTVLRGDGVLAIDELIACLYSALDGVSWSVGLILFPMKSDRRLFAWMGSSGCLLSPLWAPLPLPC